MSYPHRHLLAIEGLHPPEIAALVARTHRANRAVIGPDPDHIEPGQRLVIINHEEPT